MTLSQLEGLNVALGEFLQEVLSVSRNAVDTENADWLLSEESAELDLFLYGLHTRGFRGMYAICEQMSRARCRAAEARLNALGRPLPVRAATVW